jgi:SAM-dependent methyltransferase
MGKQTPREKLPHFFTYQTMEGAMKVRDSGMPDEEMWDSFFSPAKILALLGLDADTRGVAEFGCGYGTFTLAAARLTQGMVHAFDIEPAMVERVREKCRREKLTNVRVKLRDFIAEGTGLEDRSTDMALLFNILHHEEPLALLSEAFRILRPGGIAAVIHWNYDPDTPRGPAMEIRPTPEQCIAWAEQAGFILYPQGRIDLRPYHYGLRFRKSP